MVGLLSNTQGIVVRSSLSKVIPSDELGRIFSMVACLEAAVPLFAFPVMTETYNHSIDIFPGSIFLINALLYFLVIVNLSVVYILVRKSLQQEAEDRVSIIDNEDTSSTDEDNQ